MTRVLATAADAGRSCPYCRFPLKEGAEAERCDVCDTLYHQDCWQEGGGCAVLGCPGGHDAAPATPPAHPSGAAYPPGSPASSQVPATQAYPGYGAPAGYPPSLPAPIPPSNASGGRTILVVAVIVALLGIGTGVVVATGAFSGGAHTSTAPPVSTVAAASAKSQVPTTPAEPTPSEQSSDREAVMELLGTYQSAYSSHDISRLSNIFAPDISRHGLAAGGCTVSHGRGAVLADYQSQFEQGSGSYELVGLSEDQIQFDSRMRAHLDAHYQITPGGAGYVNFRFADLGEGWKIGEIYATCA